MKSLLKISGLVTFILTEYFICPFFLHFSQKKGVDEIYFINTIYYRAFQTTTPLRVVVFTFSTPHKTVRELFPSYGFMTFFVICIVFIQVSPIQKKHVNDF